MHKHNFQHCKWAWQARHQVAWRLQEWKGYAGIFRWTLLTERCVMSSFFSEDSVSEMTVLSR